MSLKYFGTDGIRGEFGGSLISTDMFRRLGCAVGKYLEETRNHRDHKIVVARDTRDSGKELEKAFCEGVATPDIEIVALGVLPTPAVSMATRELHADLGVVITASHNPSTDNGIKLLSSDGRKLDEGAESRIEQLVEEIDEVPASTGINYSCDFDGIEFYVRYAQSLLAENCLKGWKIVVDAANGAAYRTTPSTLANLGAEVIEIGDTPDGVNINESCGSEHPERLANEVKKVNARLGMAHDGDGDRLVVCDESGDLVDGDELLAILGLHYIGQETLSANALVATIMSNMGLDRAIENAGGKVIRVPVGDRQVVNKMIEGGYNLGGESSGHVIFSDHSLISDGLLAAIKIIEVMLQRGEPLSQLRKCITHFPQSRCDLYVKEKVPLMDKSQLVAEMTLLENSLSGSGRILVRYSGTEPKIRLLVEGENAEQVENCLIELKKAVATHLNVIEG